MNLIDTKLFLEVQEHEQADFSIERDDIAPGVNDIGEFILVADAGANVQSVFDKTCDHAGGRLVADSDNCFRCPLHGWVFDPAEGCYRNKRNKQSLAFEQNEQRVTIHQKQRVLKFPDEVVSALDSTTIDLRFVAHACFRITVGDFSLVLDPWLFGPAFSLGWWHRYPPKTDAKEILRNADAIFVSHNHTDHLHEESLAFVNPEARLLAPKFASGSAVQALANCGYTDVDELVFNRVYTINNELAVAVLDSGDFRDDSGIYLRTRDRELLFAVDSNMLNAWTLPIGIDYLLTSFTSGASGYPWCWSIYSEEQKAEIADRAKQAALEQVDTYIEKTRPRHFVPYAGYFAPLNPDDSYIKDNLRHNSPTELIETLQPKYPSTTFINPIEHDLIDLSTTDGKPGRVDLPRAYEVDAGYIGEYRSREENRYGDFSRDELDDYFDIQTFRDDLILYIELSSWDFQPTQGGTVVDFRDGGVTHHHTTSTLEQHWEQDDESVRKLWMCVRQAPFARVIRNRLSWEEISIGFQCRFRRKPDVYNVDFWHYFSNQVR